VRTAGHQIISVVLGAPTRGTRFTETVRLIDWAAAQNSPLQARAQ
jgi:D-alanyl-D-alanine carboxypeptidase